MAAENFKAESGYMMGHSTSEADRLDQQHVFFNHVVDGHVINPTLDRSQIRRVLDIGTGTGIWCRDAAAALGDADVQVVGIDVAASGHWERYQQQGEASITFRVVDLTDEAALDRLHEEFGPFDLINSRMMISSVKNGQWAAYIRRMFRLLRPGGYVQLFEADFINFNAGRLGDRTVAEALIITHAVYSGMGLDPETAVRLADWLYQAGFTRVRDVACWCNPVTRQADGSLGIDEVLYQWHSTAYGVVKSLFLKVRASPEYPRFLEKLPAHAIQNLAGAASPEALLANEAEYDDFMRRHEAVLTSNPAYRTVFRAVVAQRPR
ncbi:hypothetical protein PRZ48_013126 [Zasmidium cellare]|uniref:Methyltransferase domain-containing protein n=1 Tax=Zasmidium cellare TaxID=395010 RepID=A0ABR0E356_ZASCE|nr:hypothetical protein PRZ48_013126 [Zasmidium cellare]